jgi:uncharacterized membrane protein (DUF373 family)
LKSPRGATHDVAARAIDQVEDGIYIIVAVLLVVAGVLILWSAATSLATDLELKKNAVDTAVTAILDKGLLLFIIAELLHTVRVTIHERTLVIEPFLIVGLIAAVRRLLLVTAQVATTETFSWSSNGIEIMVLLALVLGISLSLVLLRRFRGQPDPEGS